VLDAGCGAGLDLFVAAGVVGHWGARDRHRHFTGHACVRTECRARARRSPRPR
jgi:hypothetical protein